MSAQHEPRSLWQHLKLASNSLMLQVKAYVREVFLSCVSQRVTSVVIMMIVSVSVVLVLGTAGLAAATQSSVLATVDQVGTRSIAVYSKNPERGLPVHVLEFAQQLDIVQSAVGFSETVDVMNAAFDGGKRVALRLVYGQLARKLVENFEAEGGDFRSRPSSGDVQAFATDDALELLGLPPQGGGARVVNEGADVTVLGSVHLPEYLKGLSPTLLAPVESTKSLAVIYVSTYSPEQVALASSVLRSQLSELNAEDYSIETSQAYVNLRSAIDGKLTQSTHMLVVSVLSIASLATMLVVWAVVLLRRRDLGRRRALGASQLMIIALMMGQVFILTLMGSVLGTVCAYVGIVALSQPVPPLNFALQVARVLACMCTLLSILPAGWAASRDPLSELRVP